MCFIQGEAFSIHPCLETCLGIGGKSCRRLERKQQGEGKSIKNHPQVNQKRPGDKAFPLFTEGLYKNMVFFPSLFYYSHFKFNIEKQANSVLIQTNSA